ncbi:hypothetical protein Tco_1118205, partial [Tanacetum coccineum]
LWNLKVKEYNIVAYTQRFNELALMFPRMVEQEKVKVDAYIWGLTSRKSQARDERILEGKKRKWESFQSGNGSGKVHDQVKQVWKGWAQAKVILGTDAQGRLSKSVDRNNA